MNKEIQKLLSSNKEAEISKGIELFEKKGSLKELALVLDILETELSDQLENRIIDMIGYIKTKEANSIIIDAVLKAKKASGNLRALMQICWQSSLDFTQHLDLFTDIFISEDYLTALEAFTVIENVWADYSFNEEHQQLLLDKLKDSLGTMDENKLILAKELILILEA